MKGTCLDYMHGLLLGVVKTLGLPSPEGHSREIYDYQRTAQIKRHVKERKLTLEDSDSIAEFSKPLLFRNYMCESTSSTPNILK